MRARTHKYGIRFQRQVWRGRDLSRRRRTLYNFAHIDNSERKPRQHNANQVITVHCLTVCVDRLPRLPLVFCCLLIACDCSAISPFTTTVRPHEPSLQHVRRFHVMLTTELQSVQPTILLHSPRSRDASAPA